MEIIDILMGYGPILFSGAVMGAIVSYLGPEIIKKMKTNFNHKRILDLHEKYEQNPEKFSKKQPELKKFFEKKGWSECECPNCMWLRAKLKSE